MDGDGKEQWPSMISYNGHFKKGKKHGKGKLEYPVAEKKHKKVIGGIEEKTKEEYYEGMFENGEFNGKGVYVWSDGRKFKGHFVNGKMTGLGMFTWKDNRKYFGYYLDDVKHGLGEYSWPDGRIWKGGWKFGIQHGRGVLIKKNVNGETVKRGIWVDGKRVEWLDPKDTEWPKGIDEVNLEMFEENEISIEEEAPPIEEMKKSEENNKGGFFGNFSNLIEKISDTVQKKKTISLTTNMDEYLKEYMKSYLEPPKTPKSPTSKSISKQNSALGKNRDPKDNMFIRKSVDQSSPPVSSIKQEIILDKRDGDVVKSMASSNGEIKNTENQKNNILNPKKTWNENEIDRDFYGVQKIKSNEKINFNENDLNVELNKNLGNEEK